MISLSDVATSLGLSASPVSLVQIVKYLRLCPPVSVESVAGRAAFLTSFGLDKAIQDKWAQFNWENGPLGAPESPVLSRLDGAVRYVSFAGGSIYWTAVSGGYAVLEPIRSKYEEILTGQEYPLNPDNIHGFANWVPTADTAPTLGSQGQFNRFSILRDSQLYCAFSIYSYGPTGVHWIENEDNCGQLGKLWETKLGGANGFLGFPVSDPEYSVLTEPDPAVFYVNNTSHFRNGAITHQKDIYYVYAPEGTLKYRYDALLNALGDAAPATSPVGTAGSGTVPPPSATGVSAVRIYNCHTDRRTVYLWMCDYNEPSAGWKSLGSFSDQYNEWDVCPAGNEPMPIDLKDGHLYLIVAVDPGAIGAEGSNDPELLACRRWAVQVLGDKDGPVWWDTII